MKTNYPLTAQNSEYPLQQTGTPISRAQIQKQKNDEDDARIRAVLEANRGACEEREKIAKNGGTPRLDFTPIPKLKPTSSTYLIHVTGSLKVEEVR